MASESDFYSIKNSTLHISIPKGKTTTPNINNNKEEEYSPKSIHYLNLIATETSKYSKKEIQIESSPPMNFNLQIKSNHSSSKKKEKIEKNQTTIYSQSNHKPKARNLLKEFNESESSPSSDHLLSLFAKNTKDKNGETLEVLIQKKLQAKSEKEEKKKISRSKVLFEQLITTDLAENESSAPISSSPPIIPYKWEGKEVTSLSNQHKKSISPKQEHNKNDSATNLTDHSHAIQSPDFQRTPTPIRTRNATERDTSPKNLNDANLTYSELLTWFPKRPRMEEDENLSPFLSSSNSTNNSNEVNLTKDKGKITSKISNRKEQLSSLPQSFYCCDICRREIKGKYWECRLHNGTQTLRLHIHCRRIQSCRACGKEVLQGTCVTSHGLRWHLYCFNCKNCHVPLSSFFYLRKKKTYPFPHSVFCTKCKNI